MSKIKSVMSGKKASNNALLVTTGTVIGQLMLIIATPIISRLYTPSEMGVYAVFASLIGVFSVIIAGHYELAIPLTRSMIEARRLVKLSVMVVAIFSFLIGVVFYFFGSDISYLLEAEGLVEYLWMAPIILFLYGVVTVLGYLSIKMKTFLLTAISKGMQGIGQVTPQITLGLFGFGVIGLILGQVFAQLLSIISFLPGINAKKMIISKSDSISRLLVLARRYKSFPLFTVWSSLVNSLSSHLPVFALAFLFGPVVTGLYALSFRILQMPARFIGQSISQVFFSIAADANREGKLKVITIKLFRGLFAFGLPSFVVLALVAPVLFGFIFGPGWEEAGVYAQALMPWVLLSFIATTLSILVSVMNKQSSEFYFQILILLTTLLSIGVGLFVDNAMLVIWVLGISGAAILLVKILWMLHMVGISLKESFSVCVRELPLTLFMLVSYLALNHYVGMPYISIFIIILFLSGIHLYNLKFRKVYGFEE